MLSKGSSKKFSSQWGDFNPRDINKTNKTNKTFPFKPDQIRMFSFCRTEMALIVIEVLKVKMKSFWAEFQKNDRCGRSKNQVQHMCLDKKISN